MAFDLTTVAAGIIVRSCDAAVEFAMTLLVGLVVAGIMRSMLGAEGIRALFAGAGIRGLARAWAVGMVLPVCSLGVIPIARELLRARIPSGTVLAFILAAPHINPISLLYGLTLSSPMVIVCYALASLGIAIGGGALWERFFNEGPSGGDALAPAEPSPPRARAGCWPWPWWQPAGRWGCQRRWRSPPPSSTAWWRACCRMASLG